MDSLEIKRFALAIENFIHESTLPKEVIRYVLTDLLNVVTQEAKEEIIGQLEKEQCNEQSIFPN